MLLTCSLFFHSKKNVPLPFFPPPPFSFRKITYLALYAFNGPYFPFSEMFGPGVGAHDGDLERMTVRLDAETGEVRFFLFFRSLSPFFLVLSG